MITKNEIIFNNPKIEAMMDADREFSVLRMAGSVEEATRRMSSLTVQEIGEQIIAGYWTSLIADAMMGTLRYKKWFDFTYETLHNLPFSIVALYNLQKESYSVEKNADIIAKTLGAVCYGLAMNEHGCQLIVEKGKGKTLWGDSLHIYINMLSRMDFLEPALQTVKASPILVNNGVFIEVTPLIDAYSKATGIKLNEYGLGSIMLN